MVYQYDNGFVILVGGVDNVDKWICPLYMDEVHTLLPMPLVGSTLQAVQTLWDSFG